LSSPESYAFELSLRGVELGKAIRPIVALLFSFYKYYHCHVSNTTQPSVPLGQVNQVLACLAGVKVGCVHLCQVLWFYIGAGVQLGCNCTPGFWFCTPPPVWHIATKIVTVHNISGITLLFLPVGHDHA